jgi:GTP-binding protein
MILKSVPGPAVDPDKPLQMQITILDYSSYVGRIGVGRIRSGRILKGQRAALARSDGKVVIGKVTLLERYFGLKRREVDSADAGDIVALAGFDEIGIGDTVTDADRPDPLPPLSIDEPTLAMEFTVNDSPLSGREGKFVTSRHLRERLLKEQQTNVGLKIEPLAGEGRFRVKGRGELHLAILIETMRREDYELSVSRPEVLYKEEKGQVLEPNEYLVIDVPTDHQGTVIESLGRRSGRMVHMNTEGTTRVRLEYIIPSRGLLGLKSELLTMTKGLALMHHSFHGWAPKGADPAPRAQGVLIAMEVGKTTAYALFNLQERGTLFVGAGVSVYEGMIVGATSRGNDLVVNPCKAKAMSNMRSKSTDEALTLEPAHPPTLEQALEFIDATELLEVTPQNLRLRKKILVSSLRKRSEKAD